MAVNMEMEDTPRRVDAKLFTNNESNEPGGCGEPSRNEANSVLHPEELVSKPSDKPPSDSSCASTWRTNVPEVSGGDVRKGTSRYSPNVAEGCPAKKETTPGAEPEGDLQVPQPALAFTIEFHDNKQIDPTKYHNLFERYTARHKRNSSTSKVEMGGRKQSSLLSPDGLPKQKVPSTHSEGYFSSEDDTKRKTDQLLDKLKQSGSESLAKGCFAAEKSQLTSKSRASRYKADRTSRSYEGRPTRCAGKLSRESLSLEIETSGESNSRAYWETRNSTAINNLSRVQMNNYDDENNEKCYTKNIDYVNNDYKSEQDAAAPDPDDTIADLSAKISNIDSSLNDYNTKNTNERDCNLSSVSYTMDVEGRGPDATTNVTNANLDVFNVSNVDAASDGAVSEAGTYTIHKDYTDEEKARMDIDKVFSVGVLTAEEFNEPYVHSFKMSISRDSNTWISEWASQVAEHNSLPPVIGGSTGRGTPPLSPSKIPSPINSRIQRSYRNRHEQSDSSIDAESYMRIKARLGGSSNNQSTLIDSGGESDDDTSNSYNTPPQSSQRTPTHAGGGQLTRRSSLSESLLRRMSSGESRKGLRKYYNADNSQNDEAIPAESVKSPSHLVTSRYVPARRSSSLDRKEYISDTTESNTSRKSSLKCQPGDHSKHTNSPVLSRLNCATSKLTNSPIISRRTSSMKIIDSPTSSERNENLSKSTSHAKNVGYFTCVENSPYMLRKSNSTTSYRDATGSVEFSHKKISVLQNSPEFRHAPNIHRSSSNASIRNAKAPSGLGRRSSFNNSDAEKTSGRGRFNAASDSSSETGDRQTKSSVQHTPASNIKFNRAFSIRRARLECESDTTPNTTPEERRRRAQTEVKGPMSASKQANYHRARTSSVGAHSKESVKKSDPPKARAPSISRTDSGRFSMRIPKSPYTTPPSAQRSNQKPSKDQKKSTRSNSTLTSKEVEFQNWKRRKNYDPMKAAAEGRKKLADTSRKQSSVENSSESYDNSVLRSASFHGTGGSLSVANDWPDDETNFTHNDEHDAPAPSSPQLDSDSDLETSSYLQTTQNVVSAMSARITIYRPSLMDSDGDSDEDTSHSLYRNTSKARPVSDTESSDERPPIAQPPISNTKYNRAFSLRRARLETQARKTTASSGGSKTCQEARGKLETAVGIARTDSGRFSMRISRSNNSAAKAKAKETKKPAVPNAREVEMQNWKRRKSYDPMKAAMEGRKKATLLKKSSNASLSPSHVARSQSFHGSAGLATNDWSDEELAVSADETHLY